MKPNILITTRVQREWVKDLENYANLKLNQSEKVLDKEDLIKMIENVSCLICFSGDQIDADVMKAAPELKLIGSLSVGLDNIDLETASRRGILVINTPEALTNSTAELTMALILCLSRHIVQLDRLVSDGNWHRKTLLTDFLGTELAGKTVGIIGLGRIGTAVARRAKAFDMRVIYNDLTRYLEKERTFGVEFMEIDDLLQQSDYVCLHVNLNSLSHRLINEEKLRKMKRTAYLINMSRGAVLDESALVAALMNDWIAGAALDVFEKEPLQKNSPLLDLHNVLRTPHIGSATLEARFRMLQSITEDITRFFVKGERPRYLANPESMIIGSKRE